MILVTGDRKGMQPSKYFTLFISQDQKHNWHTHSPPGKGPLKLMFGGLRPINHIHRNE